MTHPQRNKSLSQPDEYGLIASHYRSDAAYQMARRQAKANSQTYEDLAQEIGFKLNFHLHLPNHDPSKVMGVLRCQSTGKEFILWTDSENYTIFIPKARVAICYKYGKLYTQDVAKTTRDWEERIKMAMLGYDNFFELPNKINGQPDTLLQLRQEDSQECGG